MRNENQNSQGNQVQPSPNAPGKHELLDMEQLENVQGAGVLTSGSGPIQL